MSLMMGELIKTNTQLMTTHLAPNSHTTQPQSQEKKLVCYNCQETGHLVSQCENPCKLCKSPDHRHFQCHLYNGRKPTVQNQQGTALLMNLMAEKRSHDEQSQDSYVKLNLDNKRQRPIAMDDRVPRLRSGKANNQVPIVKQPSNKKKSKENTEELPKKSVPVQVNQDSSSSSIEKQQTHKEMLPTDYGSPSTLQPMDMDRTIEVKETSIPKDNQRKISNVTYHSAPPITRTSNKRAQNAEVGNLVQTLMDRPVFSSSLNDIVTLSPASRTQFKSALTKSQRNPRGKPVMLADGVEEPFLEAETVNPVKDSIPRIRGFVNGIECEMILDTGCSTFIIGAHFAQRLGIEKLFKSNQELLLGNGAAAKCLGEVRGLQIVVGDVVSATVDAVCLDVEDKFDFVIGHPGLQHFGIGVDMRNQYWYFRMPNGDIIDAEVYHDNRRQLYAENQDNDSDYTEEPEQYDDDSNYEDYYLLILVSDDEENDNANVNSNNKDSTMLNLYSQVYNNELLNEHQRKRLMEVIEENSECFGTDYADLEQTTLTKFHIDTGDNPPVYRRPYSWFSYAEREYLREDLKKMVESGILIPTTHVPANSSNSGWSFPCRYVKKKTGDRRLVTDFRELNKITVRDTWPLPNLVDVLEALGSANFYSTLDLLKGFHQIAVDENSIPKLTIATPWGCYSYRVLPFGVINGPACFSRTVYLAIEPFINDCAIAYLDDVTIYNKSIDKQIESLGKVFQRFIDVRTKLNPNKCMFLQQKVELLGFIVSPNGIQPTQSKIDKILQFPRPTNQTGIRAFVNLCGFYRRHVNLFSDICAPLNDLLKKNVPFVWSEKCEKAFITLKEALKNATVLKFPDHNLPYRLYTDASDIGVGACLSQMDKDGEERPVCFISRKLQPTEVRYPTVEKEILAVIVALNKLRKYLYDNEFTLFTDNTAVSHLFYKTDPNMRLQRWIMATQEFCFKVKHLPGKHNVVADALSRYPPPPDLNDSDAEKDLDDLYDHFFMMTTSEKLLYEDWLYDILFYFRNPGDASVTRKTKTRSMKYKFQDNHLYRQVGRRYLLVPHISERIGILKEVHDGHGHYGIHATWARLYSQYWWPNAYENMKKYVGSCDACQLFSNIQDKNPPIRQVKTVNLFEQFSIDYVGPFPTSSKGNKYILVAVESFTKWPVAVAYPCADAATTAQFLYHHIFCQFGPPTNLLSDNGTHFDNEMIDNFLNIVQTHHQFTSPYRPSTNGRCERMNGTLVIALKKLSMKEPEKWDHHLDSVLYAYRTKVHETVKISPYELMYGQPPRSYRQDILQQYGRNLGFERLYQLMDRNLNNEDDHTTIENRPVIRLDLFEPGTKVIRVRARRTGKLATKYDPEVFTVIGSFANGTYQLLDSSGRPLKRRVNHSNLRRYIERTEILSAPKDQILLMGQGVLALWREGEM